MTSQLSNLIKRAPVPLRQRLVESLYVEAMVLADEAYDCFAAERPPRDAVADPALRIGFACESLKTTTRLMHVIAWLLNQRAIYAGEISINSSAAAMPLGDPIAVDWAMTSRFPPQVQVLMATSERLFERVAGLEASLDMPQTPPPVRDMMHALAAHF